MGGMRPWVLPLCIALAPALLTSHTIEINASQCMQLSVSTSVYIFYASGIKYVGYLKSHDKLARATHGLA